MQVNINWAKARNEYATGKVSSYRDLAKKYGVSLSTIVRMAKREGWQEMRTQTGNRIQAVVSERLVQAEADRLMRILAVSDVLLDKLESVIKNLPNEIAVSAFPQLTRALKDIRDIQCGEDDKKAEAININIAGAEDWTA